MIGWSNQAPIYRHNGSHFEIFDTHSNYCRLAALENNLIPFQSFSSLGVHVGWGIAISDTLLDCPKFLLRADYVLELSPLIINLYYQNISHIKWMVYYKSHSYKNMALSQRTSWENLLVTLTYTSKTDLCICWSRKLLQMTKVWTVTHPDVKQITIFMLARQK